MVLLNNLGPNLNSKSVNETRYRGMIGSLMYLTASRPNIKFSTYLCARYQANPKESYLIAVKRIFRYLKAKAEYVAAVSCCANILWMKIQLIDYDIIYEKYQLVDIFTKPLDEPTFKRLIVELGRVRREIGITTFRNALKEHYIPHSTMYVPLPFTTTVDYAKIIWDDLIHKLNKKNKEKIIPYHSVHNLTLKPNQPKFSNHMKAICNLVVPVDSKDPKPSSQDEKVPKAKILELQLDSEEKSSLAKNKSPSHPLPPIPMVGKMHKEAQQAASGPTSLGATSKEGAHPQLSSDSKAKANPGLSSLNDYIPPQQGIDEGTKNTSYDYIFVGSNANVLVHKTKSAREGLKTVNTKSGASKALGADEISKKIKLEDLADILKDTRSSFITLDSLTDEPIIISDMSEEEENVENDKDTEDTLVPPLSPN
nr:retrovirus-related Pol polyprotein from transposon TNT 1-94 [Tanacetum cinerariifolium]